MTQYLEIQRVDGNIEGSLLVYSLGSTDGKVMGSNEGIKLRLSVGKVLGTILGNLYGITLGLDVGTELSLYIYPFMVLMMVNLEGLLLGDSLEYTHSKVIGSDEGTKLELSGEMFFTKNQKPRDMHYKKNKCRSSSCILCKHCFINLLQLTYNKFK